MSVIYINENKNPLKSPIYRRFLEWIQNENNFIDNEEQEIYYSKGKKLTYGISCNLIKSNELNEYEYLVLVRFRKKIKDDYLESCLRILSDLLNCDNDYYIGEIRGSYIDGKINTDNEIEMVCAGVTDKKGIINAGLALINQILALSAIFQNSYM